MSCVHCNTLAPIYPRTLQHETTVHNTRLDKYGKKYCYHRYTSLHAPHSHNDTMTMTINDNDHPASRPYHNHGHDLLNSPTNHLLSNISVIKATFCTSSSLHLQFVRKGNVELLF